MTARAIVQDHGSHGEPDRATVRGNNIVVDVIVNDDDSVTIETYPYAQPEPPGKRVAVTIEEERLTSTGNVLNLIITEQ